MGHGRNTVSCNSVRNRAICRCRISVIVSVLVYRRRESRGGLPLFLLFMAISIWTLANSLEAASVPETLKILWSKVAYTGAQTAPVFLLLMAAEYTGRGKRITPLTKALLFVFPAVIILLAATNDFHNLIWTGFEPGPPGTNSIVYLHGTAYWAAIAYVLTCCSLATALLIFSVAGSQDIYRKQSRYFLAASLFPWLGAALYILDINPLPGLDTISISFLFTGLLLLFALHRKQLMDMVPISHELIIEHLDDAVLVIDQKYCLVDTNAAADSLLGLSKKDDLGKPAGDIQEFWEAVASDILEEKSSRHEITLQDADKTLDVKISPLKDHGTRFIGWGLILSDVTNMKEIEKKQQKTNVRLKHRIEENKKLEDQLRDQVMRDSLTGVYNRAYLEETLGRDLARAARENAPLSILMLDVDNFKKINDNYGHKMGDEVDLCYR